MSEHLAAGPEGGSLLGFLASLGALAALSRAWPERDVRLSWRFHDAAWRPVIHVRDEATDDEIVHALHLALSRGSFGAPIASLGDDLPVEATRFAAAAADVAAAATPQDRADADFIAALGSEACVDSRGRVQDTALRTMSGAGHQHFLRSIRQLGELTTEDDLGAALFKAWSYADPGPSMRWDPVDDRRYAYRADDPSSSRRFPIRTVRGANRLAVEALPYFPTVPRGRRLLTAGFPESDGGRTLRWPIWKPRLPRTTVRSLLVHPELAATPLRADLLSLLGVVEVFRSRRITVGQHRNFTPADALLGGVRAPE